MEEDFASNGQNEENFPLLKVDESHITVPVDQPTNAQPISRNKLGIFMGKQIKFS